MKLLWKIIVNFLAIVGALTLALAAYLYFADPLGLRELFQQAPTYPAPTESPSGENTINLSPAQKLLLEKAGLDATALPTTISPELEQCLTKAVGAERAAQIKAGSVPTPTEIIKAKSCL